MVVLLVCCETEPEYLFVAIIIVIVLLLLSNISLLSFGREILTYPAM